MTVRYAVTFEFDTRPAITLRGTVAGSAAATCVARATRIAQRTLKPVGWSSMLCVLLKRVDSELRVDAPRAAAAVDPREDSNTGTLTTRVGA